MAVRRRLARWLSVRIACECQTGGEPGGGRGVVQVLWMGFRSSTQSQLVLD